MRLPLAGRPKPLMSTRRLSAEIVFTEPEAEPETATAACDTGGCVWHLARRGAPPMKRFTVTMR